MLMLLPVLTKVAAWLTEAQGWKNLSTWAVLSSSVM